MSETNFFFNIVNGIYKKTIKLFVNPYSKASFNWLAVRKIKNLREYTLQTITFFGHKFSFQSRDEFLHSVKEIFIEEIYKQQLKAKPYIIDCGANIGLSVIYLKRLFPDAKIIAFEPDEINFNLLEKNVWSFGFKDIELRKEAVWKENTQLNFINSGSLMSKVEEKAVNKSTITVKATRLKDLMTEHIDFLKIDIEGAEYQVLKDIEENLHFVQNMFIEYHGTFEQNHELNEIFQMLLNNGFKYYIKHAVEKHPVPFIRTPTIDYDVQLNIFCFRK